MSTTLRNWKRGGELHPVATLVPLDEAERFFAVSTDDGLRTCLAIADDLSLLIRTTKDRMTVQYAAKGGKQKRYYAFRGYGPSVYVAVDKEWARRKSEGEATPKVPTGRPSRDGGGTLMKSKHTGRTLVIRWS